MSLSFTLNEQDKKFLCRQAALAIDTGFSDGSIPAAPDRPDINLDSSTLFSELGSFVTLTINAQLRGCIGTIIAHEPLWLNVWNMARAAAFQDTRFPPLNQKEWSRCHFEISVLDQPSLCPDPAEIKIGRDGLILEYHGQSGVFLPQVPVEQGWDLNEYLTQLCRKAGLPTETWKKSDARLYWYQAMVFSCNDN